MYQKLFESWRKYKNNVISERTLPTATGEYGSSLQEFINRVRGEAEKPADSVQSLIEGKDKIWIFFDTETTGLKSEKRYHQVTQFAAIAVDPKGFAKGVDPEIIDKINIKVRLADDTVGMMRWEQEKESAFEADWERKQREHAAKVKAAEEAGEPPPPPLSQYEKYRPIKANLSMTQFGKSRDPKKQVRSAFAQKLAAAKEAGEPTEDIRLSDIEYEKPVYYSRQEAIDLIQEFLDKYPNRILVAQNAPFDVKFMNEMYARAGRVAPDDQAFDTVKFFMKHLVPVLKKMDAALKAGEEMSPEDVALSQTLRHPETKNISVSLGRLIEGFGVKNEGWHDALADVLMLMKTLRAVINFFEDRPDLMATPPASEEELNRPRRGKPSTVQERRSRRY